MRPSVTLQCWLQPGAAQPSGAAQKTVRDERFQPNPPGFALGPAGEQGRI